MQSNLHILDMGRHQRPNQVADQRAAKSEMSWGFVLMKTALLFDFNGAPQCHVATDPKSVGVAELALMLVCGSLLLPSQAYQGT